MRCITCFSDPVNEAALPQRFPNPFSNIPHPLAHRAAKLLQARLNDECHWQHNFNAADGGRMLGVLVVKDGDGQIGYLAAFSGTIDDSGEQPGFVPPIFEQQEVEHLISDEMAGIARIQSELDSIAQDSRLSELQYQLNELLQQRNREIQSLREVQQHQKSERRIARQVIEQSAEHGSEEAAKALVMLSFESQRDRQALKSLQKAWRDKLGSLEQHIEAIETKRAHLIAERRRAERKCERKRYSAYRLTNLQGDVTTVTELFGEKLPVAGSGECAAIKLLHYAQRHALMPLALSEFWWGRSPAAEVRHHGHFYPACRGRCGQLLPFMLKGLPLQSRSISNRDFCDDGELDIVYEDDAIVVVNKPSGLLSVPGKEINDSVLQRLRARYPDASGPLLVHRLDMATSGVLLAAKSSAAHKALHQQFERRSVEKRYVAVVSKRLSEVCDNGVIELPLQVDIFDRPRQRLCSAHGKPATTHWQVISREPDRTRLYFYPITGRTHQLRLHAAHSAGLDAPIVGDELYGFPAERLLLHAERLCIDHPVSGIRETFSVAAPF